MWSSVCQGKSWGVLILVLILCHFGGAATNEILNDEVLKEERDQDQIDRLMMTAYGENDGYKSGVDEMGSPIIKQKRSALGLLRLATKRPHKTVADYVSLLFANFWGDHRLIHAPSQDSFVSVRGRRNSYPPILDLFRTFLNDNALEGVKCAVGGKEVS